MALGNYKIKCKKKKTAKKVENIHFNEIPQMYEGYAENQIQQVNVPPGGTTHQVAMGTGSGALQGATIGNQIAPGGYGALAGGVVGGAAGLASGLKEKRIANRDNTRAKAFNAQAETMNAMRFDPRFQGYQIPTAKDGINMSKKYKIPKYNYGGYAAAAQFAPQLINAFASEEFNRNQEAQDVMQFGTQAAGTGIAMYGQQQQQNPNTYIDPNTQPIPMYEQGGEAKDLISIEGGELGFVKKGNGYIIAWDSKGGKPHDAHVEEGYITKAQEGMIVVPKAQRSEVEKYLIKGKKGTYMGAKINPISVSAFEKNVINKLPSKEEVMQKQGLMKAANGFNPDGTINPNDEVGNINPWGTNRVTATRREEFIDTPLDPVLRVQSQPVPAASRQVARNNNPYSPHEIGRYANIANNLRRGAEPIDEQQRRFLDSEGYQYSDLSDSLRRRSLEQQKVGIFNAGNVRGSQGQRLGYQNQIGNRYYNQLSDIENAEIARKYQIANANVDLRNRDAAGNLNLANQYDALDQRSAAQKAAYTDTALNEFAGLSEVQTSEDYMRYRDVKLDSRDQQSVRILAFKHGLTEQDLNSVFRDGGYSVKNIEKAERSGLISQEKATRLKDAFNNVIGKTPTGDERRANRRINGYKRRTSGIPRESPNFDLIPG